jgi:hypothetical protein
LAIFENQRLDLKEEFIMPATIRCKDSEKAEIKEILLREIGKLVDLTNIDNGDPVTVEETEDGLQIDYPSDQIYGNYIDYVQMIPDIFQDVKNHFKDIGVHGIVYGCNKFAGEPFGPMFYCEQQDENLTVTYVWQACIICGKYVEGDATYNSMQWDLGEGNFDCLCCPTCMLEHALIEGGAELRINASISDDEKEKFVDEDSYVENELFWSRIVANLDEYMDDFAANQDRVAALMEIKNLNVEKRAVLLEILNRIQTDKPNKQRPADLFEL